jgi:DNA-binding NarL/FixJ family response regulator
VVVVDRCPIAAEGFRSVLTRHEGLSVVGIAHNAAGALREIMLTSPDVVLLDLDLGTDDGVELIAVLVKRCIHCAVLVVSDQIAKLVTAVRAGARGFLIKNSPVEEIVTAVHQVAAGSTPVSAPLLPLLLSEVCDPRGRRALSIRELEVLRRVAEGRTNAEIAKAFFLSLLDEQGIHHAMPGRHDHDKRHCRQAAPVRPEQHDDALHRPRSETVVSCAHERVSSALQR